MRNMWQREEGRSKTRTKRDVENVAEASRRREERGTGAGGGAGVGGE